jgi:hypothetical protein
VTSDALALAGRALFLLPAGALRQAPDLAHLGAASAPAANCEAQRTRGINMNDAIGGSLAVAVRRRPGCERVLPDHVVGAMSPVQAERAMIERSVSGILLVKL